MTTFVSVDDFTGTDQSKIDQAIAAVAATGGTIVFPKRVYTIQSFELSSDINVIGNGSTITRAENLDKYLITIASGARNVNIEGLIFNGNKATQTQNNAGGILAIHNEDVNITNCVFYDIARVAIAIVDSARFDIKNVKFYNLGKQAAGTLGVSVEIQSSKDILVENAFTLDSYGEGMSARRSQRLIFRNHSYSCPSFTTYDNGLTFTECSEFEIENVEVSYMKMGIEINACHRFRLSEINLHNNIKNNLLISTHTDTVETLGSNGEISNVVSRDSGEPVGINIIGNHNLSFNNITDNKQARFAASGAPGFELVNVEVKNSTFNVLELTGARNIRLVNNTIASRAISNTSYSMIDLQNKFEAYFQADLNNNDAVNITIPLTAAGGTTFFHGTLEVENTFTPSASLQFSAKLVHIKLIWDKLYQNIISTLNGSTSGRDFQITGSNNTLNVKNISGVSTTLRGRLTGTIAMY